ncbi:phytochrome-like protein [Pseudomonas sp. LP_4_YM]|nr:phytochrome-like protein [Pseudomonas sp. LP_4_YM]
MTTDQTLAQAIERCAQEPIQVPGSIQPHGFVLVLDPEHLHILQVSENIVQWLGRPADTLLGCSFDEIVQAGFDMRQHLARLPKDEAFPFHIGDVRLHDRAPYREELHLLAHRHDGVLIVELEPPRVPEDLTAQGDYYPLVRAFVSSLHLAGSLEELLQQTVVQLKRVTGFGRVKAYRFDAHGNGEVLAEVADPGYPSFLGLCFPASDIPRQARELYRVNRIRVIEDANYQSSPLLPPLNPVTGNPLDMSFTSLRSVSPVHLQYMRNMDTLASMSLSIVVDGQLWGLISCHHAQPRPVALRTRTACELLASVLSLQIESREAHASTRQLLELRQYIVRMISSMADHDSVSEGLRALPDVLMAFAGAQGAAIISAEYCERVGITPPEAQVNAGTLAGPPR